MGDVRVGIVSLLQVGRPLGEMVGYEFLGTWKTSEAAEAAQFGFVPGDAKFTDLNDDKVYNAPHTPLQAKEDDMKIFIQHLQVWQVQLF